MLLPSIPQRHLCCPSESLFCCLFLKFMWMETCNMCSFGSSTFVEDTIIPLLLVPTLVKHTYPMCLYTCEPILCPPSFIPHNLHNKFWYFKSSMSALLGYFWPFIFGSYSVPLCYLNYYSFEVSLKIW